MRRVAWSLHNISSKISSCEFDAQALYANDHVLCVTLYVGETSKSVPSSHTVNALVSLKSPRTMCFVLGTTTPNRTGSNTYGKRQEQR